ncbi:hypothetical protein ASPCADRAFT_173596 [Aspergillus carbonarius ITEM 5010]|uniref:Uncharacterized protein n=1 Tax=Aspergillus carbonarius (strain ITEM 5010) TaxID=602072 RepID=A0A1R3RES5_ASPC5|nr:hypothetical protein ASPCADRAFT_173596 [Aspergillus carbonarius ITEM 5010]
MLSATTRACHRPGIPLRCLECEISHSGTRHPLICVDFETNNTVVPGFKSVYFKLALTADDCLFLTVMHSSEGALIRMPSPGL